MSDTVLDAPSASTKSKDDWYTRKCPNDACSTMNHARRNNCSQCGAFLGDRKPKIISSRTPKPPKVPSGPPRGTSTGILTKAAKSAITQKANRAAAAAAQKGKAADVDSIDVRTVAVVGDVPGLADPVHSRIMDQFFPPADAGASTVTLDPQPASIRIPPQPPEPPATTVVGAPEPPRQVGSYIALQDFSTTVNGFMVTMSKDKILTDYNLIGIFLREGRPIVPVSEVGEVACCPRCQHVFKVAAR